MKRADRAQAFAIIKNMTASMESERSIINHLNSIGLYPYPRYVWTEKSLRDFKRAWFDGKGWIASTNRQISEDGLSTLPDPSAPPRQSVSQWADANRKVSSPAADPIFAQPIAQVDDKPVSSTAPENLLRGDRQIPLGLPNEEARSPRPENPLAFLEPFMRTQVMDAELEAAQQIIRSGLSIAKKKQVIRTLLAEKAV